jgi:hypothetical protein
VPDGSFQYTKLSAAGDFFNWGLIELRAEQMKRTKNSRKMHMVFNVQSGTVEVKVHENEFTVHKGGIWQVPRGRLHLFFSFAFPFVFFPSRTGCATPHQPGPRCSQRQFASCICALSAHEGAALQLYRTNRLSANWNSSSQAASMRNCLMQTLPQSQPSTSPSRFPNRHPHCIKTVTMRVDWVGNLHIPTAYDVAQTRSSKRRTARTRPSVQAKNSVFPSPAATRRRQTTQHAVHAV